MNQICCELIIYHERMQIVQINGYIYMCGGMRKPFTWSKYYVSVFIMYCVEQTLRITGHFNFSKSGNY